MLRAAFIALSESRWLRAVAEHRRFGQRISARFVAGKEVADAIRATTAVNQFGASVSIDNLGENVTNAAHMSPRNFIRVDMEGSAHTQRTLDFVHELHRVPGNEDSVGAVIQSYMR